MSKDPELTSVSPHRSNPVRKSAKYMFWKMTFEWIISTKRCSTLKALGQAGYSPRGHFTHRLANLGAGFCFGLVLAPYVAQGNLELSRLQLEALTQMPVWQAFLGGVARWQMLSAGAPVHSQWICRCTRIKDSIIFSSKCWWPEFSEYTG
jgi:hypothetical protein